ncbi:MAG TPA: plastocyanin/azurin family copper-binding protein [Chloroflexota bacterium]|nr:plastocyanin/azurin family copper-binding protein [Chloroflexota bacterium]
MHRTFPPPRLSRRATWPALAAATALLAGCGAAGPRATGSTAQVSGSDGPQLVTLKASEFAFSAPTVRVQVNRPVRLVLENGGLLEHDVKAVRVPASGVKTSSEGHGHGNDVAAHSLPGKQAWVEFTPTRKGTYALECTVTGHKEAGMKGTLIVE